MSQRTLKLIADQRQKLTQLLVNSVEQEMASIRNNWVVESQKMTPEVLRNEISTTRICMDGWESIAMDWPDFFEVDKCEVKIEVLKAQLKKVK